MFQLDERPEILRCDTRKISRFESLRLDAESNVIQERECEGFDGAPHAVVPPLPKCSAVNNATRSCRLWTNRSSTLSPRDVGADSQRSRLLPARSARCRFRDFMKAVVSI